MQHRIRKRTEKKVMNNSYRDGQCSIPPEYSPLSAWAYFAYRLLFAIPVVGFVFLIVFSCGGCRNQNLRSFARSYWCTLLVIAAVASIVLLVMLVLGVSVGSLAS